MAQFSAKKIDTTTINGGQQVVNGSGVTPELFNAPVESALYTEKAIEVLTSTVDVSQGSADETPTVSFASKTEGGVEYKYLKFANLKGKTGARGPQGLKGDKGDKGERGLQGNVGEAAGFGTPTISVETLDEGSTATASVRATGEDTAKVFNFNFGLPKGDTGRGIATVVSDGNDLIIKYDDGSDDDRLKGVIQTINALVADSRDDFEAAQIEENIGKTISYKGDLYLILGKNRTKLVNNGVTDYNALYNTPVYIATSEEAFNEYLQSYNVNKIVSYNGDLYTVVETKNAPIVVDDTIDKLYFNTSVEPDLTKITLVEGMAVLLEASSSNVPLSIVVGDFSVISEGAINAMVLADNESGVYFYSTASFMIPAEDDKSDDVVVAQGWNTDIIANGGVFQWTEDSDGTITAVNQQDLWGSYVSKEPFGTIAEKKVSGVPSGGTAGQVLTKTTDNDYDAEWAYVSGGVTDVQVNGTSIVEDGVAKIPAASTTEQGVVTTEAQTFNGKKNFNGNIWVKGEIVVGSGHDVCIKGSNNGLTVCGSTELYGSSNKAFPIVIGSTSDYIKIDPKTQKITGYSGGTSTDLTAGFTKGTKASGTSGSLSISTTGYTAGFYSIFFSVDDVYYNAHLYYGYRNASLASDVPEAVSTPTFVYDSTTQSIVYYTVELLSGVFRLCKNDLNGNKTVDTTTKLTYRINNAI
jgi:hypothetical protein